MGRLYVVGPRDIVPADAKLVNTTSQSKDFGLIFSPFLNQGPIEIGGLRAHNVENLWQFTKVYLEHVDRPDEWVKWRDAGLADKWAHRYPMGKGSKPEYSLLNDEQLGYVSARRRIYGPAYLQKLHRYCSRGIQTLKDMLKETDVALWDFDGYRTDKNFQEVMADPKRKMGHAFVLKAYMRWVSSR